MKFLPAEGYIAVIIKTETKTKSGIFIPDNALGEDRMSKGEVVGTSMRRIETTGEYLAPKFNLDDIVLFGKGSGNPFKFNGVDLVILGEDEIFGTIKE
jgi:chaperonin GroES